MFRNIQSGLPRHLDFKNHKLKRESKGLKNRILNCFEVVSKQGQVNHITGDVHYISFLMKKRRTLLTIHDLEVLNRLSGISRRLLKFFWFTLPSKRVKYITVISEFTKQELLKVINVNSDKVIVIHDCISPEITPSKKQFDNVKPNILHIGTAHNKNLERLIEAIDGLPVQLTILGHLRENQIERLKKHKINYSNYFNLPYSEVIQQYKNADLISFASLYEGFGLPIIEANAIGRPIITSNRTSMPEVAANAAVLVDPENVQEIRNAILLVIKDENFRNQLIINGFENVKRFSPENIGQQYSNLYDRIIKES